MDPLRYQKIKRLLMDALDLPVGQRAEFLTQECGADSDLHDRVQALLVADSEDGFMEQGPLAADLAAETAADASGQQFGRIRLDRLLARGGMGEVYAGTDTLLQRNVAVKLMKAELRMSAARRSAFLAEAQVLSGLQHPNICQVHDFFADRGQDLLVLELIDGETLRDTLSSGPPADPIGIAIQIANALVSAHERGIAHRDLKPENVMLTSSGQVKVLDFGLARSESVEIDAIEDAATGGTPGHRTQVVGTPGYLAPEQARGEAATTASDLWSFGLLLSELLSGRRPYRDSLSSRELLLRARRGEIDLPTALPVAETALIKRLLSPQARQRPSAREALLALQRIAARPARRLRWAFASAALLLVLFSGYKYTTDLQLERQLALAAQQRAEQAQQHAETARAEAEDLAQYMIGELYQGLRGVGRLDLLESVALKAVSYYDSVGLQQAGQLNRQQAMALLHSAEIIDLQGHQAAALTAFERAAAALQRLADGNSEDAQLQLLLGGALDKLANQTCLVGKYRDCEAIARRAVAIGQQLTAGFAPGLGPAEAPSGEARWFMLLGAMDLTAEALLRRGEIPAAREVVDQMYPLAQSAAAVVPGLRRRLGHVQFKRCSVYYDADMGLQAVSACREALGVDEAELQSKPDDFLLRLNLVYSHWMMGKSLHRAGKPEQARDSLALGEKWARELIAREPEHADAINALSVILVARGEHLVESDDPRAQAVLAEVLTLNGPLDVVPEELNVAHHRLIALTHLGRLEQAIPYALQLQEAGWRRPDFLRLCESFELLTSCNLEQP